MIREIPLPGRRSPYAITKCESSELLRQIQQHRPEYIPNNIQEQATDFLIDLVAFHYAAIDKKGNIVGALRALETPSNFPGLLENSALYQQPILSEEKINQGVIEASRVWTRPGKSLLFIRLIREIVEYCLQHNVRYLIFSSEEFLKPTYLAFGCKIIQEMFGWYIFEFDMHDIVNPKDVINGATPMIKESYNEPMAAAY